MQEIPVVFHLARGGMDVDIPVTVPIGDKYQILHPKYVPDVDENHDVAVLKLVDQDPATRTSTRLLVAPYTATQYQLLIPGTDVSNRNFEVVGYGLTGTGETGGIEGTGGKKRKGFNTIEGMADTFLQYDFDDGTPENNKMGTLGLDETFEAMMSGGDSGGPMFIEKKIVGINSFIAHPEYPEGVYPPKFGDVGHGVRVSAFHDDLIVRYIDNAGAYDLVLDMQQQVYGRSDAPPPPGFVGPMPPDELTITRPRTSTATSNCG